MQIKDIRTVKTKMREEFREKRTNLAPETKKDYDTKITRRVLSLKQYASSRVIFVYMSKKIEVGTRRIIEQAWKAGKRVAVPRCVTEDLSMDFYYINSFDDLEEGAFGVLEPKTSNELVKDFSSGLCIVPGLGFDVEGYRLGYGKGYYDRFLSGYGGVTVGVCYYNCVKWKLPHGRYDRQVNFLITERYIRKIT